MSRSRIIEDFIVIWFDLHIDETNDAYQQTISQLRPLINSIKLFTDADECFTFITELQSVKIFLIVSNVVPEIFLSSVRDMNKFNRNYEQWIKIRDESDDISLLCDELKQNIRQCQQDLLPISMISSCSTSQLNELNPSFMYSQLLKEILIKMEYDDKAKCEFIEFCRAQYAGNRYLLNIIEDFERNYHDHPPIWWYTKESFIYSILNKALRTHDIEVIINMRYFICELYRQIEQLFLQKKFTNIFTVYRGQGVFNDDFENIMKSKDGLLSFSNLLSTSFDRDVSLIFARSSRMNANLTGILFEIEIDPYINSSASFVSLENLSYYPEEKEVLFSMHTVFHISEMKQIEDRLWQVNLNLISDADEQLTQLTEVIRTEIKGETGWDQLGYLMIKMSEFIKAENIYRTLLDSTPSSSDVKRLVRRQNQLATALYHTGNLQEALSYLEKAFDMQQQSSSLKYEDLYHGYSRIASVHSSLGNYSTCLSLTEKAHEIAERLFPPDDYMNLADSYHGLGWIHYLLNHHTDALSYCNKAIALIEKSGIKDHLFPSNLFDSIGRIYYAMKDYSNALIYYEKSFEINKKSLPPNHALFAADYCNIGEIHHVKGNYQTALSFFQQALEIRQKSFPPEHLNIGDVHNNIGEVYNSMSEHSTALYHFNKALAITQKSRPANHPFLSVIAKNIADVQAAMKLNESTIVVPSNL
mgnify:CR=1 FL=1